MPGAAPPELEKQDLCGYVLKKDSPSCGMERVRVYRAGDPAVRDGRGVFAEALIDGDALAAGRGRGTPERRVAARELHRARVRLPPPARSVRGGLAAGDVVAFHTAHKLQLMAHAPKAYAELGRLVAGMKRLPRAELRELPGGLHGALAKRATPGRNANVLEHMGGYLRDRLDAADRAELAGLIRDHRVGLAPLVVPLTLIRHHARRFGIAYLLEQVWLDPHPKELMLRNHV